MIRLFIVFYLLFMKMTKQIKINTYMANNNFTSQCQEFTLRKNFKENKTWYYLKLHQ